MTSQEELARLAADQSEEVAAAVMANPSAPEWAKETPLERAKNSETPSDVLGKLVLSGDEEVVEAALGNPSTPEWASKRARRDRGESLPDSGPAPGARRAFRGMPLSTTDHLPGQKITEVLGLVYASKSHTQWKALSQYERLLKAMEGSEAELVDRTRSLGGNAVIGIQVSANSASGKGSGFDGGNSDGVIVVGTAVRAVPEVTAEKMQRCMSCRELVHHLAVKCRYCHEALGGKDDSNDGTGRSQE